MREQLGIADLPRAVRLGRVQYRLAMEANDIRRAPDHAHGDGMVAGEPLLHLFQERVIRGEGGGEVQQTAQIGAQAILVAQHHARAEMVDPLTVSLDPGSVHAIQRGAGHEADGAEGWGGHGVSWLLLGRKNAHGSGFSHAALSEEKGDCDAA